MVEITIKLPDETIKELHRAGIDWSLVIKRVIKQIEEEKEMTDWSVKLQHASRKGRYDELKRRGLI